MILPLLIAATVGFFVGQDAQKRGMNPWGWGIGVFLLMIVFLPIYFITRKPLLEKQVNSNDDVLDDDQDLLEELDN